MDGRDETSLSRRRVLATTTAAGLGLLAGCTGGGGTTRGSDPEARERGEWRSTELTTVRGGEPFTVDGFDRPVVVQSFAVWCSTCQQQSEEMAGLDDSVVRVGLNTDTNEAVEKVRQHAERNGFDWRFAVASTDLVDALTEAFGNAVVNHPQAPVIVTCQDGTTEFLSGSVNSAGELASTADDC